MRTRRIVFMAPAVQQMPPIPERIASPWALETAVQTLAKERHDRVLIRLLDKPIVGHVRPDIGTVESFAGAGRRAAGDPRNP